MIKEQYARVKKVLTLNANARDNDNILLAEIWSEDRLDYRGCDILQLLVEGKLTNFESVRRARQKAQEENPELRGKKYRERAERENLIEKDLKLISVEERFGHKKLVHSEGDLFPDEV
jgi:hypothetical protein